MALCVAAGFLRHTKGVISQLCSIRWFKFPGHTTSQRHVSDIIFGLHVRLPAKQARCEALATKLDDPMRRIELGPITLSS